MIRQGEIVGSKDGYLWVRIPCDDKDNEDIRLRREVLVELQDGYSITAAQRRKAYVLLSAIALWQGDSPLEVAKTITKLIFTSDGHTLKDTFSLSGCTREEARLYITWLLDFCIMNDIPINEPAWKLAEDLPRYTYACLMAKKCVVCGLTGKGKVHLHHVDTVGANGGNRNWISHIGLRALPLCATHHRAIHDIGTHDFLERYIVEPVKIDERIADRYRLRKKSKKNK